MEILAVAVGGALGALMRFSVSFLSNKFLANDYPWATFIVNIVGAFIIGFLWGYFERVEAAKHIKSFALIGVVGSFTTFSTLSLDAVKMLQAGQTKSALMYLLTTNFLGVSMVILGYIFAQRLGRTAIA